MLVFEKQRVIDKDGEMRMNENGWNAGMRFAFAMFSTRILRQQQTPREITVPLQNCSIREAQTARFRRLRLWRRTLFSEVPELQCWFRPGWLGLLCRRIHHQQTLARGCCSLKWPELVQSKPNIHDKSTVWIRLNVLSAPEWW